MEDTNFTKLKSNWIIILFIGSLVVTWTMFSSRLSQAESEIDQLSEVVNQINEININMAIIATDIKYIREQIQKK